MSSITDENAATVAKYLHANVNVDFGNYRRIGSKSGETNSMLRQRLSPFFQTLINTFGWLPASPFKDQIHQASKLLYEPIALEHASGDSDVTDTGRRAEGTDKSSGTSTDEAEQADQLTKLIGASEVSLSETLCVRHNMSKRKNMYAKQNETRRASGKPSGVAAHS